jgi:hypothetical protein
MLSETAVLFIFSAFLAGQAKADCDHVAAKECLKLFWKTTLYVAENVTETELDSICPVVPEMESCVRRAECFPDSQLILKAWAGVKDTNKYICNEGKQAFLRNINCLNSRNFFKSIHDCKKHFDNVTLFNYCGLTSKFFNCTRHAALTKCGEEGQRVYTTIVHKLYKPIAPFYGCRLGQAETNCNHSAVEDCLNAVSYPNKTDYDNITEPVLNSMCLVIPEIESCVRRADCVPDSQLVVKAWAGVKDTYKYVCNKGKQAFLRNINCLKSVEVYKSARTCHRHCRHVTIFNYCSVTNELFNCTSDAALFCGEEGQRLYTTIVYKLYKPIAPFYGCQLVRTINQPTNRTNLIEVPTQQPTDRPIQQPSHRHSDRRTNRRNDRPT